MPTDLRISELPVVTSVVNSDLFTTVREGDPAGTKNKKNPASQVATYIGNVIPLPVEQTYTFIATAGQTIFLGLPTIPPDPTLVKAFRNGQKAEYGLAPTGDFTVTSDTLVWNGSDLLAGETISGYYNDAALIRERQVYPKSTSVTLTDDEVGAVIPVDAVSDVIITLPETSTEFIALGGWWTVYNEGVNNVAIAIEGSDVLNGTPSVPPGFGVEIIKTASGTPNTYDIIGGSIPADFSYSFVNLDPTPQPITAFTNSGMYLIRLKAALNADEGTHLMLTGHHLSTGYTQTTVGASNLVVSEPVPGDFQYQINIGPDYNIIINTTTGVATFSTVSGAAIGTTELFITKILPV